MNQDFSYKTSFVLDKPYFIECFEQSVKKELTLRDYFKAIFFIAFGALLVITTDINPYASWFIFTLGILEALSVYYQKPWWVTRQMLSRVSNSSVELEVSDKGVFTKNFKSNTELSWQAIETIEKTEKGWLLIQGGNKTYLAKGHLSDEAIKFVNNKLAQKGIH